MLGNGCHFKYLTHDNRPLSIPIQLELQAPGEPDLWRRAAYSAIAGVRGS
jgi:hypothetical protein